MYICAYILRKYMGMNNQKLMKMPIYRKSTGMRGKEGAGSEVSL